jgi:glycosyltransferase involved in cell wall biosynthesis
MQVSIIVPVYNVADYLDECMQSLLDQSFGGSIEVLLIEDCSADSSLQLCEAWTEKRPDVFKLLKNDKNRGVSVTRNRGLDAMSGDYFTFVDPDDLVPADAIENLYQAAEAYRADIVKGNNTVVQQQREKLSRYSVDRTEILQGQDILQSLFLHEKVRGHIWSKLFRREALGQYRLTPGVRMAQDLLYMSELFAHANSMVLLDKTVYRYRKHSEGSTGSKFRSGSYQDWMESVERCGEVCRSKKDRLAHRNLQFRSINQLTRECAKLSPTEISNVYSFIVDLQRRWGLDFMSACRTDLKSVLRYLKFRLALKKAKATSV